MRDAREVHAGEAPQYGQQPRPGLVEVGGPVAADARDAQREARDLLAPLRRPGLAVVGVEVVQVDRAAVRAADQELLGIEDQLLVGQQALQLLQEQAGDLFGAGLPVEKAADE